jgi:hypothetical protein
MITVKQLIHKLQKLDQSAPVLVRDHDQSDNEYSGWVKTVVEQEREEFDGEQDLPDDVACVVVLCS